MQNQPGVTPQKRTRDSAKHDKQAAGLSDDAFKGGSVDHGDAAPEWLRSPWKPAAGRLFGNPKSPK